MSFSQSFNAITATYFSVEQWLQRRDSLLRWQKSHLVTFCEQGLVADSAACSLLANEPTPAELTNIIVFSQRYRRKAWNTLKKTGPDFFHLRYLIHTPEIRDDVWQYLFESANLQVEDWVFLFGHTIYHFEEIAERILSLEYSNYDLRQIMKSVPSYQDRCFKLLGMGGFSQVDLAWLTAFIPKYDTITWPELLKQNPENGFLHDIIKNSSKYQSEAIAYILAHKPTESDFELIMKVSGDTHAVKISSLRKQSHP